MNNRLQQFLTLENLSPARLADILGIQRSGLSHILSGRNKPGYDFILKLCTRFPHLNANWFITGKGKPYSDSNIPASNDQTEIKPPAPSPVGSQNFGMAKNMNGNGNGNVNGGIYSNAQQINFQSNEILKGSSNFNHNSDQELQNLPQNPANDLLPISDLFDDIEENTAHLIDNQSNTLKNTASYPHENQINGQSKASAHKKKSVKRVIIFYNDGSFDELFPAKDLL